MYVQEVTKGEVSDKAPPLAVETGRVGVRFNAVELSWRHRPNQRFQLAITNPTVVRCHGISTKMLVLSRSSQQNQVAYKTVDLTLCFFYLL